VFAGIKRKLSTQKVKIWLFSNVLVGLFPLIIKGVLFFLYFEKRDELIPVETGDFIVFGLILNIGNIFQIFDLQINKKELSTGYLAGTITFIVCFFALYTMSTS